MVSCGRVSCRFRLFQMGALQQIEHEARAYYRQLWAQWYSTHRGCHAAALDVAIDDVAAAGYSPSRDLIYLPVCSGDVEEYARLVSDSSFAEEEKWRVWKQSLVHEMLHEFQHKAAPVPTETGRALLASHRWRFDGPGHDDIFYTAVAECAHCFDLSPEELRDRL